MTAPEVGEHDVERILRRDYPAAAHDDLRAAIDRLEVRFKLRVVMACLKNAAGDVAKLQGQLADAPGYYRDIMWEAESPNEKKRWSRWEGLSAAERQAFAAEDRRQYEEWLHRA